MRDEKNGLVEKIREEIRNLHEKTDLVHKSDDFFRIKGKDRGPFMGKRYRTSWFTKAVYVGGGSLMVAGGIVLTRGMIREGIGLVSYGLLLENLVYLHTRWERHQYKQEFPKRYSRK